MECASFQALRSKHATYPLSREVWDTSEHQQWLDHFLSCKECTEWELRQRVLDRGADPADFPCVCIADAATNDCDMHPDRRDCPDALVDYSPKLREFGLLIHDGGSSIAVIKYCPWCGTRLPESLRERWYEELRQRGIDPWIDEIPEEYSDDRWYRHA